MPLESEASRSRRIIGSVLRDKLSNTFCTSQEHITVRSKAIRSSVRTFFIVFFPPNCDKFNNFTPEESNKRQQIYELYTKPIFQHPLRTVDLY